MKNLKSQISNLKFGWKFNKSGVAALAVNLLIGAVVVEIALTVAFISYLLNFTNFGIRLSNQAFAAAQAGIDDGLARLSQGTADDNSSYSFDLGDIDVDVYIDEQSNGQTYLDAKASILSKKKTLRAVIEIDAVTKKINIVDIIEI